MNTTRSFSYKAGPSQRVKLDAARLLVAKDLTAEDGSLREVTLVFLRPDLSPDCIEQARLVLQRVAVTGDSAELGVYPSAALGFARGQTPEVPSQLLDNQPSGHATVTPGTVSLQIDVTSLVRGWLAGAFPSQHKIVPHSLPMLFTVQPPDLTEGAYSVGFAGVPTTRSPVLEIAHRC